MLAARVQHSREIQVPRPILLLLTTAAPMLFRDHISVPSIPALARACGHTSLSDFNRNDIATWHGNENDGWLS